MVIRWKGGQGHSRWEDILTGKGGIQWKLGQGHAHLMY